MLHIAGYTPKFQGLFHLYLDTSLHLMCVSFSNVSSLILKKMLSNFRKLCGFLYYVKAYLHSEYLLRIQGTKATLLFSPFNCFLTNLCVQRKAVYKCSTFTVLTRNLLISVQREKRRQNSIKIQARKNKRSSRVFQRFSQKTERRRGKKFIASPKKKTTTFVIINVA